MYGHPKFKPTWNEQTSILHSGVGIITSPQNLNSSLDPWIQGAVALNSPDAPTRYFAPLLGPGGWWRLRVPPSDPSPWLALENPPRSIFPKHGWSLGMSVRFFKQKKCAGFLQKLYTFHWKMNPVLVQCGLCELMSHEIFTNYSPAILGILWDRAGRLDITSFGKIGLPYASH